jgi:glycine dehydrogenase
MKINLLQNEKFEGRHLGPDQASMATMLASIGVSSLEQLVAETVPAAIRRAPMKGLPTAKSEAQFLKEFKKLAEKNQIFKSYIGLGYHPTLVPPVILRNIMENPGWYTAYTPYQAEIAQGRLEMLINFQTLVIELTGLEIANASLLDEGTAAAEALALLHAVRPREKKDANRFFVSDQTLPQTIDLLKTRATPLGIELVVGDPAKFDITDPALYGMLLQYPGADGQVADHTALIAAAHEQKVLVCLAADLLALTLLKSPGQMGADVAVGSAQRFGVPMGYGGPHAAFFATKDEYKRQMPGRIIGVSRDAQGKVAYRMALQTREQHIRREKATSNICTAQVLLSVMAAAYAVYHGPHGLRQIGERVHGMATLLANALTAIGFKVKHQHFFDTVVVESNEEITQNIRERAEDAGVNFRYLPDSRCVGISLNQAATLDDLAEIISIFTGSNDLTYVYDVSGKALAVNSGLPSALVRPVDYLQQTVFNKHHSEHEMLRYLKHLENKDISMVHSMIPLGSCTMKLNATAEMIPVTWPEFGNLHPFAPADQTKGYEKMFRNLEKWLSEVTGFAAVSLQPNSGAQGEYAGLMVIRAYHLDRGDTQRNVALIPTSAHGTNPASAVMAGMKVVLVKCDERGNIDLVDLKARAEEHKAQLAALMVTYPSTHGVFEEDIREICQTIHQNGGLVYMDGANMNAQVGLTSPANIGADVCHLNLHKTFCIPHGGGGPGMGPIGVVERLAPYLPGHVMRETGGAKAITAVSAAPWGSASILTISYAYICMMGAEGLTRATEVAILNANYIKARLEPHYPILYTGKNGRCAHEMIIDCRNFKTTAGIEVEDIAKRLMDYGFHAPTVSFPVAGTLMIEPTESEPKEELDRFCEAMIAVRNEIREIENGQASREDNLLHHAPHTAELVMADEWHRPYSRQRAAYPLPYLKTHKVWPTVSRIDSAFGDRNLVCSCLPVSEYEEAKIEA